MTNDAKQPLERRRVRQPTEPLPSQPDERGTVTIVGLETAGTKLRPRRLRLRRRKQAHTTRKAPLKLRRPGVMQRPRRLDRDQRRPAHTTPTNETRELVDALAQRRQRNRLT